MNNNTEVDNFNPYIADFDPFEEAFAQESEERYLYLSIFDNFELNEYVHDDFIRINKIKDSLIKEDEVKKLKQKIFDYTNMPSDHEFLIDDYIHDNID